LPPRPRPRPEVKFNFANDLYSQMESQMAKQFKEGALEIA
jgi:hypothetical protein